MNNIWFPYKQPSNSSNPLLFCFSHSGGVASNFRNWQGLYPSNIEVIPVQLPGRETRFKDPFITSMEDLIDQLLKAISPFFMRKVAFFGHSLGGVIAYELARRVQIDSLILCVSACTPPHYLESSISLHNLPEKEFIEQLKGYGAMPQQLLQNLDVLQVLMPRLRADFELFETYSPPEFSKLSNPLIICGGDADEIVPLEKLNKWKEYTTSSAEIHTFSGDHFYHQHFASDIAKILEKHLL